jgi:succinoglycan biosynthesis protein ExoM
MYFSFCVATYRRPERVGLLLDDLEEQVYLPRDFVVVDNDAASNALPVRQHRLCAVYAARLAAKQPRAAQPA